MKHIVIVKRDRDYSLHGEIKSFSPDHILDGISKLIGVDKANIEKLTDNPNRHTNVYGIKELSRNATYFDVFTHLYNEFPRRHAHYIEVDVSLDT